MNAIKRWLVSKLDLPSWGLCTLEEKALDVETERCNGESRLLIMRAANEKQRYALRDEYECEITKMSQHIVNVLEVKRRDEMCGCKQLLHYTLVLDPVYFTGCYPGDDRMRDYLEHMLRRAASKMVHHGLHRGKGAQW